MVNGVAWFVHDHATGALAGLIPTDRFGQGEGALTKVRWIESNASFV